MDVKGETKKWYTGGGERASFSSSWMVVGMVEVQSGLQLSCGEWPHRLAPGIVAAAQSQAGGQREDYRWMWGRDWKWVWMWMWMSRHDLEREKDGKRMRKWQKKQWILKRRPPGWKMRTHRESIKASKTGNTQTTRLNNTNLLICQWFILPWLHSLS